MQKTGDSVPGLGRSLGGGNGNPLQYSCGQRSLVGYSPWGHKESDTTEQLNNNSLLWLSLLKVEQQKARRWQRGWQRCRRERETESEKEKEKVGWEETSVRQEAQCTCCFKTWGNTHDSNSIFQLGLLISKQPRTLVRRYHEETALVQFTGVLYTDMWWKQQLLFTISIESTSELPAITLKSWACW